MLSPSGSRVFTVQVAEVSEFGPPVWRPKASLRPKEVQGFRL